MFVSTGWLLPIDDFEKGVDEVTMCWSVVIVIRMLLDIECEHWVRTPAAVHVALVVDIVMPRQHLFADVRF